ncbi:unnamed protein product [Arabis nemorensis]|uniref:Uncharacterized protein n=1 Tax=Arabis nemorensis TaxID=586526 RepID=A0A565AXC5_9BRAS|nr:unnamed protein product [Arabis nemorensis]
MRSLIANIVPGCLMTSTIARRNCIPVTTEGTHDDLSLWRKDDGNARLMLTSTDMPGKTIGE